MSIYEWTDEHGSTHVTEKYGPAEQVYIPMADAVYVGQRHLLAEPIVEYVLADPNVPVDVQRDADRLMRDSYRRLTDPDELQRVMDRINERKRLRRKQRPRKWLDTGTCSCASCDALRTQVKQQEEQENA